MQPLRTLLFAPGNHPRKVAKVFGAGADIVILDLEDAVAISEKAATRETIVAALSENRSRTSRGYVRVNAIETTFCYGDIQATIGPWLDGIVLPKVESPNQLETIDWLITQIETERGLEAGTIDLLPIIETGKGLANIEAIAHSGTRVKRVSFGAGDFTNDMGMIWTPDEPELYHARASIALASRAAGLEPPIDTVFIDLKDSKHLEKSARTALTMGYQGKLCIHPNQVEPVNTVFTPTDEEVARARKFITAFEKAEAEGSASIQVDGYFVDYPIVERAQRTVQIVEAIRAHGG